MGTENAVALPADVQQFWVDVKHSEKQITDITVTAENKGDVNDFVVALKKIRTKINAAKVGVGKPFDEQKREAQKPYKDLFDKVEEIIKLGEGKVTEFIKEERRLEAERLLEQKQQASKSLEEQKLEAIENNDFETAQKIEGMIQRPQAPSVPQTRVRTSNSTTAEKKVVTIISVDLNKVPDKYIKKSLDEAVAKRDLAAGLTIPGIQASVDTQFSARARRS